MTAHGTLRNAGEGLVVLPWLLMSVTCGVASADIISVPGDYATIQDAIIAATDGDEVVVAPDTYNETIDFLGKAIYLHSSDGADLTTIDATGLEASVVVCMSGEGPDTILEGFTITGGTGTYQEPLGDYIGGGMANVDSSPTVNDCIFTANTADDGGGMYNDGASPTITRCQFIEHDAHYGGAMHNRYASHPMMIECEFTDNTAEICAGIYNGFYSSPTVRDCIFMANSTENNRGGGMSNYFRSDPIVEGCTFAQNHATRGAGIHSGSDCAPTITGCLFLENTATEWGAGMANDRSTPIVSDCTFEGNWAGQYGGAMYSFGSGLDVADCLFLLNEAGEEGGAIQSKRGETAISFCTFSGNTAPDGGAIRTREKDLTLVNCLFTENTADRGGGMACYESRPELINCTFAVNSAAHGRTLACFSDGYPSDVVMANCILWNGGDEVWNEDDSTIAITYSDIQGGYEGEGNIDIDPLFVDPLSDDFHLSTDSPCTDAGDNTAVPEDTTTDLDGNPRFVDNPLMPDTGFGTPPIVDIGAYEFPSGSGEPVTYHVDPGDSIQAVITIASSGDEIIAAPGTYNETIDFLGKAIYLHSSDGAAVTILDGSGPGGSVVTCMNGEGSDTVLEGFTITGGTGMYEESLEQLVGGGMVNLYSSPTVNDCIFTGNTAHYGGGMGNLHLSNPTVANCAFTGNTAEYSGGGMVNYGLSCPTVTDCEFSENTSFHRGGGLTNLWMSSPTVGYCTFIDNLATSDYDEGRGGGLADNIWCQSVIFNCTFTGNMTGSEGHGGGMSVHDFSTTIVTDCVFTENSAAGGAGLFSDTQAAPTVIGCTFVDNTAGYTGGGGVQNWTAELTVINCLFHNNTAGSWGGGGIQNDYVGTTTAVNCTIALNEASGYGGGVSNYEGTVFLSNCIVWANSAPSSPQIGGPATVMYSCVEGGYEGEGNIDAEPLFVGPDSDDFQISSGSPCIDAADNTAVPEDITTDLDGNPRFVDDPDTEDTGNGQPPIVDMGAYEYQGEPCPADFDDDGDVDTADLLYLLGAWGTGDGDVDGDGDTDAADLLTLLAAWGACP